MDENDERKARLEEAWLDLSKHGSRVTVAMLAKAAGCSNTFAGPFLREKVVSPGASANAVGYLNNALALRPRDRLQSAILELASVAQGQVGELIRLLEGALDRRNDTGRRRGSSTATQQDSVPTQIPAPSYDDGRPVQERPPSPIKGDVEQASHPVPFIDAVEAPLTPPDPFPVSSSTRRPGRRKSSNPDQFALDFASASAAGDLDHLTSLASVPSAMAEKPADTTASTKVVDSDRPLSDVVVVEGQDHSAPTRERIIEATALILRTERGPLGSFAIGERLGLMGVPDHPRKHLKGLLQTGCPTFFEYEEASRKFWANLETVGPEGIMSESVRVAAIRASIACLEELRRPSSLAKLHAKLPDEVRQAISPEAFAIAIKTADSSHEQLLENHSGHWYLAKHDNPGAGKPNPEMMHAALRRVVDRLLAESEVSLGPPQILEKLPPWISRHFTAANIDDHLKQISAGLDRDGWGRLSIRGAAYARSQGQPIALKPLARTSKAIDAAIDCLNTERRSMSLEELYDPTAGISRDAFRKAMNQRQKASHELERIDEGRYRYSWRFPSPT